MALILQVKGTILSIDHQFKPICHLGRWAREDLVVKGLLTLCNEGKVGGV